MECRCLSHYRNSVKNWKNCISTQIIFTEIELSAAELWSKNNFWNGGRPPSWILKMFINVVISLSPSSKWAVVYQISTKLDDFSLSYGDLTTRNMADVDHLEFSKFRIYVKWPLSPCYSASLWNRKICCRVMAKTTMFKMAVIRHLEF